MSCLISSSVISSATGDASGRRTTMSTSWGQCVKHDFAIVEDGRERERIICIGTQDQRFAIPVDCDSLHRI